MAKVTKKVLGASRGKVADVVFRKYRVANVAQSYQPAPQNPRTAAQVSQRTKFGKLSDLAQGMAPVINIAARYETRGTMLSPRNKFIRLNKDCFAGNAISYPEIILNGQSRLVFIPGDVDTDNPNEIKVEYEPIITGSAANQWDIYLVVYSKDMNGVVYEKDTMSGTSTGSVTINTPSSWGGLQVHLFMFAIYKGEDDVENGLYKGCASSSQFAGATNIS